MSRTRLLSLNPKPSVSESIKAKMASIKRWIYEECKSKPIRYFVSAVAGGGATLIVLGGSALIGLTGPLPIILSIIAFLAVAIRENQKLLAGQKIEGLQEENVRLLEVNRNHNQLLEKQEDKIAEQTCQLKELKEEHEKLEETTRNILSILEKHSTKDNKQEYQKLLSTLKKETPMTLDQILPGPQVKLTPLAKNAPPYDVYNTLFKDLNEKPENSEKTKVDESVSHMKEILDSVNYDKENENEEDEENEVLVTPRSHVSLILS